MSENICPEISPTVWTCPYLYCVQETLSEKVFKKKLHMSPDSSPMSSSKLYILHPKNHVLSVYHKNPLRCHTFAPILHPWPFQNHNLTASTRILRDAPSFYSFPLPLFLFLLTILPFAHSLSHVPCLNPLFKSIAQSPFFTSLVFCPFSFSVTPSQLAHPSCFITCLTKNHYFNRRLCCHHFLPHASLSPHIAHPCQVKIHPKPHLPTSASTLRVTLIYLLTNC